MLYLAITFYGSYVLTGVVEEKSSRVAEVLLSRVPPSSLLGGKIAGIGLAGLAQFAAVAAAAVGTLLVTRPSGLPPGTYAAIPMLVVWFVLGYAFYSVLYGSLGSLASRTEDAQAAAGPVIALLVAIYIAAVAAMANPGAGWVTLLSLLPPTAPMLMPLRTSLVNVPAWQVIIAVIFPSPRSTACSASAPGSTATRSCTPAHGCTCAKPGAANRAVHSRRPAPWDERPRESGQAGRGADRDEVGDGLHHLGGLFRLRVVTRAFDDPEARIRDSGASPS